MKVSGGTPGFRSPGLLKSSFPLPQTGSDVWQKSMTCFFGNENNLSPMMGFVRNEIRHEMDSS